MAFHAVRTFFFGSIASPKIATRPLQVLKDGWQRIGDCNTAPTGLGVHVAELPTAELEPGQRVDFTWRELAGGRWVGRDFRVTVATAYE